MNYPEIIIYSVNMSEFLAMMKGKKYDEATHYLLRKIECLKQADSEIAALSANAAHLLFDRLKKKSTIPLISIVEATCIESTKKGLRRPGLFRTELLFQQGLQIETLLIN